VHVMGFGWKTDFIVLPVGIGQVWLQPGSIVSARDVNEDPGFCEVVYNAGGIAAQSVRVRSTSAQVMDAIRAARAEPVVCGEALNPEEALAQEVNRQEKIAEAVGRGMAKGQKKGLDQADRESWGGLK